MAQRSRSSTGGLHLYRLYLEVQYVSNVISVFQSLTKSYDWVLEPKSTGRFRVKPLAHAKEVSISFLTTVEADTQLYCKILPPIGLKGEIWNAGRSTTKCIF